MKSVTNPERLVSEQAKATYGHVGKIELTDEQKASFKPYTVETVEDVLMLIAHSLKEKDHKTLIEIHDRLMVSDIELAYDTLIVMLQLGDARNMYYDFVPATINSKIAPKGIYHRCLNSLPIYDYGDGFYDNPVLGEESYPDFAKDIIKNKDYQFNALLYREHVSTKYATVIKAILEIR